MQLVLLLNIYKFVLSHRTRETARRKKREEKTIQQAKKKVEHEKIHSFHSVDRRKSVDLVVSGMAYRRDGEN